MGGVGPVLQGCDLVIGIFEPPHRPAALITDCLDARLSKREFALDRVEAGLRARIGRARRVHGLALSLERFLKTGQRRQLAELVFGIAQGLTGFAECALVLAYRFAERTQLLGRVFRPPLGLFERFAGLIECALARAPSLAQVFVLCLGLGRGFASPGKRRFGH